MILKQRQHHPSMGRGSIEDRGDGLLRVYLNPGWTRPPTVRDRTPGHPRPRRVVPVDAPEALRQKAEKTVNRLVDRQMVPLDELRAFAMTHAEIGPVTAADVCEEFRVTPEVAMKAMWLAA